jgi:hypothetical protein
MAAEAQLIVERATLRWLAEHHPDWTQRELAAYLRRSVDWMNKWLKRLRAADPHDVTVLYSRTRASISPPPSFAHQPLVVQRILEIREAPPEHLQRLPGPEAIPYYLYRDPLLQAAGVPLPVRKPPFGRFCALMGALPWTVDARVDRKSSKNLARKCNSISKMR